MLKRIFSLFLAAALAAIFFGCSKDEVVGPSEDGILPAYEIASLSTGVPDDVVQTFDLTPEQRAAIRALMQQYHEDLRALRESFKNGASREELQARFAELRAKLQEDIKAILTPEQYEQWQKLGGRFGHPKGPKGQLDRLGVLARVLDLTDEQRDQAKAIFDKARQDIKAAFDTITDRTALKEAIKDILQTADQEFRNILTAEQLAKYEQLGKNRKKPNG